MHEPGFLAASTPTGRRTRDTIVAVRYSDQPQLWDRIGGLSVEVWPEYNLHGDELNRYWDRLYEDFPEYQFVLYDDEDDEVLAEGHTIPCSWDGTVEGLSPGIDSTIAAASPSMRRRGSCNALAALAAEIAPRFRNRGLASVILQEMVRVARSKRLAHVLAPVRPNWKDRYPLTPIERYVAWTQDDGQPFDPRIRTHVRLGGAGF